LSSKPLEEAKQKLSQNNQTIAALEKKLVEMKNAPKKTSTKPVAIVTDAVSK
jgi:hypothetical protein